MATAHMIHPSVFLPIKTRKARRAQQFAMRSTKLIIVDIWKQVYKENIMTRGVEIKKKYSFVAKRTRQKRQDWASQEMCEILS